MIINLSKIIIFTLKTPIQHFYCIFSAVIHPTLLIQTMVPHYNAVITQRSHCRHLTYSQYEAHISHLHRNKQINMENNTKMFAAKKEEKLLLPGVIEMEGKKMRMNVCLQLHVCVSVLMLEDKWHI